MEKDFLSHRLRSSNVEYAIDDMYSSFFNVLLDSSISLERYIGKLSCKTQLFEERFYFFRFEQTRSNKTVQRIMMQSMKQFSPHGDLLDQVIPTNDDALANRLLEECKNRGRAAVQAQDWPNAVLLYKKAVECVTACSSIVAKTNDNAKQMQASKEMAIVQSNLSLAAGKMYQWEDTALPAASAATVADPTYVKGWWRLSQAYAALKNYTSAIHAMEKALEIEPSNKALKSELEKLRDQYENATSAKSHGSSQSNSFAEKNVTATAVNASKSSSTGSPGSSGPSKTDGKSNLMPMSVDEDDDAQFSKSDYIRGYKIVNGKKTSYFHNELSDDAKMLIGDIKPKQIEQPIQTTVVQEGASAWNQAGTWEEKDCTQSAKQSLGAALKEVTCEPVPNTLFIVLEAKITGTASLAMVRGKRRFLVEFGVTIDWMAGTVKGQLGYGDIDGTMDEFDLTEWRVDDGDANSVTIYKTNWDMALQECIRSWILRFPDEFMKGN